MDVVAEKQFPDNYSSTVLSVLSALSMTGLKKLKVVGSSNIRSMMYSADYDAFEVVKASSPSEIVQQLRDIVKRLRDFPETYITDIKCGEVPEWDVFSRTARVEDDVVKDFNRVASKSVVDKLRRENVITPAEAKESDALLEKATTPFGFLDAKKTIRYHVLRWKPIDILNGVLDYRGRSFVLEEAIESGGMIKIDVVSNISDRFTEFSCIYDVFIGGKRVTAPPAPIERSLTEDILYFDKTNPFKALKRFFSLVKFHKQYSVAKRMEPILNSDLGRLYQLIGDLKTLEDLLERPKAPVTEIRQQIDETRQRIGNIYQLKGILKHEHQIVGTVESLLKQSNPKLRAGLSKLIEFLEDILDVNTSGILQKLLAEKSKTA